MYSNCPLLIMKCQTVYFANLQRENLPLHKDLKRSLKLAINLKANDINIRAGCREGNRKKKES